MRYTTIIDVTECPPVWSNHNVTRVYLYLCLKCGYHDQDRDFIKISTRILAQQAGVTHAACRHALTILQKYQLIIKAGEWWRVRKYVDQQVITSREKLEKARKKDSVQKAQEQARQAQQEALDKELESRKQGSLSFLKYYEDLLKKAAAGDEEAAKTAERRRPIYESLKKQLV